MTRTLQQLQKILGAVGWSRRWGSFAFKMEGIGQAREAQSEGTILHSMKSASALLIGCPASSSNVG